MLSETAAGTPDRRSSKRKKPRGKLKIECRKGTMGLGRNIALELLNLSQTGAGLIVTGPIQRGEEVELIISSTTQFRPVKVYAQVVRAEPIDADRVAIGVSFQKQIAYSEMNNLT